MRSISTTILASALAIGGTIAAAPAAHADERVCRGYIYAVTLADVRVPAGANCILTGTRLTGNIKVERGAGLVANRVVMNGNIQSQAHRFVRVIDSRLSGSIQLESGGILDLRRNIVNGDIQLFSNPSGQKTVYSNRVGGNLQCKSNVPAPVGASNIVYGNKEGQCSRM